MREKEQRPTAGEETERDAEEKGERDAGTGVGEESSWLRMHVYAFAL